MGTAVLVVGAAQWQEYLVLVLLTAAYTIAGGMIYGAGFLQASWEQDTTIHISTAHASVINSIAFLMSMIPSPFVTMLAERWKVKPWILFILTAPLLTGSLQFSCHAKTFVELLIANGLGMGSVVMLIITTYFMSLHEYFPECRLYFFHGIAVGGCGLGIVLQSVIYAIIGQSDGTESHRGWRFIQNIESVTGVVLLLVGFVLSPCVSKALGIISFVEEEKKEKKRRKTEISEESGLRRDQQPDDEGEREPLILTGSSMRVPSRPVLLNPLFLLQLIMWGLVSATCNIVLTFQISRMIGFGSSMQTASTAFLVSGACQVVLRPLSGYLSQHFSPLRLSQSVKVLMVVFTVISNLFTGIYSQGIFVVIFALYQAVVTACDFLMGKEVLEVEQRASGMSWFVLVGGLASMGGVQAVGFTFELWHSYTIQYYLMAGGLALNLVLSHVYDVFLRRRRGTECKEDTVDTINA